MKFDPDKHHRRSYRLKGYDYSRPGSYFVTICVHDRECLFGEITNDEMHLNEYGRIVKTEWLKSSEIRNEIELDMYQIMKAYHDVGFEGPLRPDHGRMIWGETGKPG